MLLAKSIEVFKNLVQYDYNNQYYDFHNDYNCEKLTYSDGILLIMFKSVFGEIMVSLKFTEVKIQNMDIFNVRDVENLTIDNLYRGRTELNGDLVEFTETGKGYFYLDFYEGQRMEFWASELSIVQE